jgi:hypothetical protein
MGRRSESWFRTHSDLLATVNATRKAQGLPVISMPRAAKQQQPQRVERKPFRAHAVPSGYVPIEQLRVHQTPAPSQSETNAQDLIEPYWTRN